MCAIVGLFSPRPRDPETLQEVIRQMQDAHRFRGPDGTGVWGNRHVAMGSVRLAIRGGPVVGLQPLADRWGGHLVFNGELFEPRELLRSLGEEYRPEDSDGVALEALLERKGPAGLCGVRGMFALARYDARGYLTLARDTWGQKPLYLARWEDGWAFASTIAALRVLLGKLTLRPNAPLEYLIYKSIGGLHTSFEGIEQVAPGSWIRFGPDGSVESGRYTELPLPADQDNSPEAVKRELDASVAARACDEFIDALLLSGGADSSIVAASLVRQRPGVRKIAFSIGYDVAGKEDETLYASRLAQSLSLPHEILHLHAAEIPALMREAARFTEDPIQDPVTLPTLVLSRAIAAHTKIALSGDGSDEFWGGYERFDHPPATLEEYLPRTMLFHPEELGLREAPASYLDGVPIPPADLAPLDRILRIEAANRLRNYHLMRIDKLGMSAALEIRSPFLDAKVTQLANSLTAAAKRPAGRPKGLLLDAFHNDLPDWLVHRQKQPFSMPLVAWLGGPLRSYAWDTLSANGAWVSGFVDAQRYLDRFDQQPDLPTAARLWGLLQLEAWHRVWGAHLS